MQHLAVLLRALADGRFHSGVQLAASAGCSRAAICKRVKTLSGMGLEIFRVRGKGYCLARPLEMLANDTIYSRIPGSIRGRVENLEVVFGTDSTNDLLLRLPSPHGQVILAEFQTAGRGRRGNRWLSAPGAGLCLSMGWRFESAPTAPTALSLMTGVALVRALYSLGVAEVGLKWPNDLTRDGAKLAGILVESRGQAGGSMDVVIGVGVNLWLPDGLKSRIDQPAADLVSTEGETLSRNSLAAAVITHMMEMLAACERGDWASYMEEWRRHDIAIGRLARIRLPGRPDQVGTVLDVDKSGILHMQVGGEVLRFSSGELSLRVIE